MTDLFEEKSRDWDVNEMVRGISSAIGQAILEQIPLHVQMCVMDFGAGTGLISSQIAPHVNKIVAVDTSRAMLKNLTVKPELRDKVETVCQDITEKPLDRSFDLIMSAMAMHHVKDTDLLIKSFARHLHPGALIALADLDKEDGSFHPQGTEGVFHQGFDQDEFLSVLNRHGFRHIQFSIVHTIVKEDRTYPVFLVTATKD